MTSKITDILLCGDLYKSTDPYERIFSMIEYVNSLTGATSWTADGFYTLEELPEQALMSYFVDYYDAQVQQGGLSTFIINSGWNQNTNRTIRKGLEEMGAKQHLALFVELEHTIDPVIDEIEELFVQDFMGDNPVRRAVDILTQDYQGISETENLALLNANYIEALPDKKVLTPRALWQLTIDALLEKVPNKEARQQEDYERLSPEIKSILAVCEEAGQRLIAYHDFKMDDFEGNQFLTHKITTDKGLHHVVCTDTDILLCSDKTGDIIARCKPLSYNAQ